MIVMIVCIGAIIVVPFVMNICAELNKLKHLPEDDIEGKKNCKAEISSAVTMLILLTGIPAALFIFFAAAINNM